MAYDPSKIKQAPPPYVPARDLEGGPEYDDNNPPKISDYIRAANQARKSLKKLKD